MDDPLERSVAIPVPISQGLAYQIEHFLARALRMLADPSSRITEVEIEHDEAAGVDDIVIYYNGSIDDPDRPPASAEYVQVKYKASSRAILRGASFVDLKEWNSKRTLLEKMSAWWQKCGKARDVRLTLVTDAGPDPGDPFFDFVSREHGTIAVKFLTDAKTEALRRDWQNATGLDDADFATFVRCLRIDARGDSIETMKAEVLAIARGLRITGDGLSARISDVGSEIFQSRARKYGEKRLFTLLASRGLAPTLPPRLIEPKTATPVPLAARTDKRSGPLPLDVGTISGLQTGRFLGLLEGGTPERLHDALCAAQSALELLGEPDRRRAWWLAMGFGWYDAAAVFSGLQSSEAVGVLTEVLPITQHIPFLYGLAARLFEDRERDVSLVLTFDSSADPVVRQLVHELRVGGIEIPIERLTIVEPPSPATAGELLATAASGDPTQRASGLARAASWDDLLERWLIAFGPARVEELYDLCTKPDPAYPAVVDRVALALMRILARGDADAAVVQGCLARIAPLLDEATLRVVRWSMQSNPTVVELDDDAAARVLLPRSGVGAHVLEIRPHAFDVSDALVAQANMPTPDHVGALLRLSPRQRAVVGLCTGGEWRGVHAAANGEELVYLRHGRPLPAVPNPITERPD